MFYQTDRIRDYIFPIAISEQRNDEVVVKNMLGTAFLIGNQGFALTAKHVISTSRSEDLVGIFAPHTLMKEPLLFHTLYEKNHFVAGHLQYLVSKL